MLSSRTMRSLTLFVIGLALLNITYTMISWYQPLVLPTRKESGLDEVNIVKTSNEVKSTKRQTEEATESSSLSSLITLLTKEIINIDNYKLTTNHDFQPDTPETTTEETQTSSIQNEGTLKKMRQLLCPEIPPGLGPISKTLPLNVSEIVKNSTSPGGYFKFNGCRPRQRIAIIIPLRVSKRNISYTFLFHLHTFLMKQQVEYRVFVVAQNNTKQAFNRGRLINVGFTEIRQRFPNIHCFVIQEPNVVSLDTRNLYRCSWYPRQLAVIIERRDKSTFVPTFGQAVALTDEQFSKANGFSNLYWAYNSDYDHMLKRLQASSYTLEKCPFVYGKFVYLFDEIPVSKPLKISRAYSVYPADLLDGIATISYTIACYEERDYYTYISAHFPEDILNTATEN